MKGGDSLGRAKGPVGVEEPVQGGGDLEQVKGKCDQKYIISMHQDVVIKPGDFVINK